MISSSLFCALRLAVLQRWARPTASIMDESSASTSTGMMQDQFVLCVAYPLVMSRRIVLLSGYGFTKSADSLCNVFGLLS
ncbi:hypothetical protein KCU81_g555, partial [Aureobasidium melanogenum]